MAVEHKNRVSRAIDLLRDGLGPFVLRELEARLGPDWLKRIEAGRERALPRGRDGKVAWDSHALLKVMIDNWQSVFRFQLRPIERSWVGELLDVRNRFAHEQPFSAEDTHRALDTAQRLLVAVAAASPAAEIEKMKSDLLRTLYSEQHQKAVRPVETPRATNPTASREIANSGQSARRSRKQIVDERMQDLNRDFERYVQAFDQSPAFTKAGQMMNHIKAIQLRRKLGSLSSAVQSREFLDLLRNTLASWGIGSRGSVLAGPEQFMSEIRKHEPALLELERERLDDSGLSKGSVAKKIWALIQSLQIVDNNAKLVPGTKALHHLLPDLIVPMDREFTRTFFGWHVPEFQYQQEPIFYDAFNRFATLASTVEVRRLVGDGWRTSITKLIDNALVAFCRVNELKRPS